MTQTNELEPYTVDTSALDFDPDALRRKYIAERDKRLHLRSEGFAQYQHVSGELAGFAADPYAGPRRRREPLADQVDVLIVGGGFGGLLTAAELRRDGVESIRFIELGGRWEQWPSLPVPLGEVAAGIVRDRLFLVGEPSRDGGSDRRGEAPTLAYDLSRGRWEPPSSRAPRPIPDSHHAAEVWDGKLYLFGGIGPAAGKTQIYDPRTGRWTLGPDLPFAAEDTPAPLRDAFQVLLDTLRPLSGAVDPELFTEVFWAALHGLVGLTRSGRIPAQDTSRRIDVLVERFAGA